VVARLKEIAVDPKTVVLAKKVDAAAVGAPALAFPLQPGAYQYKANVQMGEQSHTADVIPLSSSKRTAPGRPLTP